MGRGRVRIPELRVQALREFLRPNTKGWFTIYIALYRIALHRVVRFTISDAIVCDAMGRKIGRKMWVRPIFTKRRLQGEYHNLLQEMRLSDPESHFRYLRMYRERFDCLLEMV